ncbi:unnamed protein product [Parnassius mnemosyne]|uniref:Uncharacterized protein n=1 Tax=Parnassius mnemosyne TaxID=213953 RepID=A0AAV1KRG0_9NEOP
MTFRFVMVFILAHNEALAKCVVPDKNESNSREFLNKEVSQDNVVKPRSKCCPYDFDPNVCKVVGDRLLCGYNRNIGGFQNNDAFQDLKNGCRIRGGRLECGYVNGPFTNPRRPPVVDNALLEVDATTDLVVDKNSSGDANVKKESLKLQKQINNYYGTTRCIEIRERIVCRQQ